MGVCLSEVRLQRCSRDLQTVYFSSDFVSRVSDQPVVIVSRLCILYGVRV